MQFSLDLTAIDVSGKTDVTYQPPASVVQKIQRWTRGTRRRLTPASRQTLAAHIRRHRRPGFYRSVPVYPFLSTLTPRVSLKRSGATAISSCRKPP